MTYRYLLVDDEALIRMGTQKKISKISSEFECSASLENGAQAIEYLEENENSVDFVITDMDMPQLDGLSFLSYLKKNFPNLPIIVISGYKNFEYVQRAVEARAINYSLNLLVKQSWQKTWRR